jgi:hypothetical protein
LKAGLGISLRWLLNCQYVVSCGWKKTYEAGEGALAAAAVVCVLIAAGPFLTIDMAAGAGEFENDRVLHIWFCLRARTAPRVGIDRSIVKVLE